MSLSDPLKEKMRALIGRVEEEILTSLQKMGEKTDLRDACEYALMSGGKRLRPLLVLLVAEGLGRGRDVMQAALSVEFFHTASLIADDLPCMDDEKMRRGKPALHKAFGESVALLSSYTLISAGYGAIQAAANDLKRQEPDSGSSIDAATARAFEIVARCAGLRGATYGQYLDLFPPDAKEETIRAIIEHKTNTLFEISFCLGWLFGGGDESLLELVGWCASHFGMAFQIADDLQDLAQDQQLGREINIVQSCGEELAIRLFCESMRGIREALQNLNLWGPAFGYLWEQLGLMSGICSSLWKEKEGEESFPSLSNLSRESSWIRSC